MVDGFDSSLAEPHFPLLVKESLSLHSKKKEEENIWSKSQGNLVQNPLQTETFPHRWELMVWIVDQDLESDTMQSQQKYFSRINFVFQSKTSVFILLCFICIACQSVLSLSFHVQQLQWETWLAIVKNTLCKTMGQNAFFFLYSYYWLLLLDVA